MYRVKFRVQCAMWNKRVESTILKRFKNRLDSDAGRSGGEAAWRRRQSVLFRVLIPGSVSRCRKWAPHGPVPAHRAARLRPGAECVSRSTLLGSDKTQRTDQCCCLPSDTLHLNIVTYLVLKYASWRLINCSFLIINVKSQLKT